MVSQKFCYILFTYSTTWQLLTLLLGSWGWRITVDSAELAWYSPNTSHRICFYGLEHDLGSRCFRPSWHFLIIEVFETQVKLLEPSGYRTGIKCAFFFHIINAFWLLPWCYGSFWICKEYVLKLDYFASSSVRLQYHIGVKQCTTCQRPNYRDTAKIYWGISVHTIYVAIFLQVIYDTVDNKYSSSISTPTTVTLQKYMEVWAFILFMLLYFN